MERGALFFISMVCLGAGACNAIEPTSSDAATVSETRQAEVNNEREATDMSAGANTARDGNIAIKEEFDAAMKSENPDKIRAFIARHPDHDLAKQAQARLAEMKE